jgi:hypothetical protein
MAKKHWYRVTIIAEKIVRVYAEDYQDAIDKADAKYGPLWNAETGYREDGTQE